MKLNLLERFFKNTQISNSQKSVQQKPSCSIRIHRHEEAASLFTILRMHLKKGDGRHNTRIINGFSAGGEVK
jgi:hypothetical protein